MVPQLSFLRAGVWLCPPGTSSSLLTPRRSAGDYESYSRKRKQDDKARVPDEQRDRHAASGEGKYEIGCSHLSPYNMVSTLLC